MSSAQLTIRTGARLHFGPLSYLPRTGRHFGGVGLMIDRPGVLLHAEKSGAGAPLLRGSARGASILARMAAQGRLDLSGLVLDVLEEIPPHNGLGSGTQLALAIAEAVLKLTGAAECLDQLAGWAGRGDRSAIGLFGYQEGGFLIDAGHAPAAPLGDLSSRVPVPPGWRIVLAIPAGAVGLHGESEQSVFQTLPAMPELTSGRLCRLALTEMLPALRREDYPRFAAAVSEYGRLVGEFFSPWQGGVYSSPVMQTLIGDLAREGTLGAAQSSWGPAVALFAANEIQAQDLKARVRRHPAGKACRIEICAPLNQGRLLLEDAAPAGRSGESGVLATEAQRHGEEGEEAVPG